MIPFAEKLSFLMRIADVSNKELAAELDVDPSMVSLMRTGKRKLPRNPGMAQRMALFFARKCSAAFQRQALSEALDQRSISVNMPTEVLASRLEDWLKGESPDIADAFLSNVQRLPRGIAAPPVLPLSPSAPVSQGETMFFYGEEGRREVMLRILYRLRQMKTPGSILTVVDDNLEWLLSDYILSKTIQQGFLELAERGFTFFQIMPPLNYINRYADSLEFWLPLYVTGQTRVYYYPRLRGNLYRHSIIVVPGQCAQYSCSVGLGNTSDIVMFTSDPMLVNAFEKQFHEHISLCKPSLNIHRDTEECVSCFAQYTGRQGDVVQSVNSLSLNSMPREMLERCMQGVANADWRQAFSIYLENTLQFEEHIRAHTYIDMCRLATAEEVRAGRVPIGMFVRDPSQQMFYTPEAYALHLRNILRLMDQYENYTFLPLRDKEAPIYNVFVNEANVALVFRTAAPLMMLEIQRPHMVVAFQENLLRKAERAGYDSTARRRTRMELRALIQELEN